MLRVVILSWIVRLHVIVRALSSSTCISHCLIEKGNSTCAKTIFFYYFSSHRLFRNFVKQTQRLWKLQKIVQQFFGDTYERLNRVKSKTWSCSSTWLVETWLVEWHWKIVSADQLPGFSLRWTFTPSGLNEKLPNLKLPQLFTAYLFRLILPVYF